jgi:hypothetical protein
MQLENQRGKRFQLEKKIGGGGEAQIWTVRNHPRVAAKIYHDPSAEREAKLNAMLARAPNAPQHIAWPTDLLYQRGRFAGFCMPLQREHLPIFRVYHPVARGRLRVSFQWRRFLHHAALNLATQVAAVHASGHVIGDLNESNVMVSAQSYVTLIDTDSFQIADTSGQIFRCPVSKAEFTPPELQGIDLKGIDRSPEHDQFALGVLIFLLLMDGVHPFAGVLRTPQSIGRVDLFAIRNGLFPYAPNARIDPPPKAPPFDGLHPDVQQLFVRCFVQGHRKPRQRPTAQEWRVALLAAKDALVDCPTEQQHVYSNHLRSCPQCATVAQPHKRVSAPRPPQDKLLDGMRQRWRQTIAPTPAVIRRSIMGGRTAARRTMHSTAHPFRTGRAPRPQAGRTAQTAPLTERLSRAWKTTLPWLELGTAYTLVNAAGFPLLFLLMLNATSVAQRVWGSPINENGVVVAAMALGGLLLGTLQRWALRFTLLRNRQKGLLWLGATAGAAAAGGALGLAAALSVGGLVWGGLVLGGSLGVAQSLILRLHRFGARSRRTWIAVNAVALASVGLQWDLGQITALTYLAVGFSGLITSATLLAMIRGTHFAPAQRRSLLPRRFQLNQMRLRHRWRTMGNARWWLGALLPLLGMLFILVQSVNLSAWQPPVEAPTTVRQAPPLPHPIQPALGDTGTPGGSLSSPVRPTADAP